MGTYYLAVDIGASGGRHMLSWLEDGKIRLEEIYRFENGMKRKDGRLCWDMEALFAEIVNGMRVCAEKGKIPSFMAIDTWAVDFVLLDAQGRRLGDAVGYRDHRTDGMDGEVERLIDRDSLYQRTGIQKQIFNTIYQLMALRKTSPELLAEADTLLMMPDYFNYLLTGVKKAEYTNATTTQLIDPKTRKWDRELIERLGYPFAIFPPVSMAGTPVGPLKEEIAERVGYQVRVIQTASHDTASAVLAVPARERDFIYISSGTWSLMGVEQAEADCSPAAQAANLTNEGGYAYRYRFLKNIMGLWMIQSVRHELDDRYSFAQLCEMAEECLDFPSLVDVNDGAFLSPDNMTEAIREACRRSAQAVPQTAGEIASVIYRSLARSYAAAAKEIEGVTKKSYGSIYIVGGGANADLLNRLTAEATGKTVYSGPTEATAIGNAVVQMLANGEFTDPEEARRAIYDSFTIRSYRS